MSKQFQRLPKSLACVLLSPGKGDAMDGEREVLEERLAGANRHVAVGRLLVDRQRKSISAGQLDAHQLGLATELLVELEQSLRLHLADRNRLRKELAKLSSRLTRVQKRNPAGAAVSVRTSRTRS
jgi:hypothetical protein